MGAYAFLHWYFHSDPKIPVEEWPLKISGKDPAGNHFYLPNELSNAWLETKYINGATPKTGEL